MVLRIVSNDGATVRRCDVVSLAARLRLPDNYMLTGREVLKDSNVMEIEVVNMEFFTPVPIRSMTRTMARLTYKASRRNKSIPVPEVFSFDTSRNNDAGFRYVL